MNKITFKQAAAAAFGAAITKCTDAASRMRSPTAEIVSRYLAVDPTTLANPINSAQQDQWVIPVTLRGEATPDTEHALHIMALMLGARLGGPAIITRRSQENAVVTDITTVSKRGSISFNVTTEQPACAIAFAPPRNALAFTALSHAGRVLVALDDCARYNVGKGNKPTRPLDAFILRNIELLRTCTRPDCWFLPHDAAYGMLRELNELRAMTRAPSTVRTFRGGFPYPMVNGLLDRLTYFDQSPLAHKGYAWASATVTDMWVAMCACEPLAFLHALISLHFPVCETDDQLTTCVLQTDHIPIPDSVPCSFDYAVEMTADGIVPR